MTTEKIRILHCLQNIGHGGVEQRRLLLAARLTSDMYKHAVVCTDEFGAVPDRLRGHGWEIHAIGHPIHILDPRWYMRGIKVAKEFQPHLIHGAVYEGCALASVIGLTLPSTPVLTEETSQPTNRRLTGHILIRAFYASSDRVIGVSPAVTRYLTDALHIPTSKVRCVLNGVADPGPPDSAAVEQAREQLGLHRNDVVIGSLGRLKDEHKRFSDLIRALPSIKARHSSAKLLIVGDGEDRRMLGELANAEGVASSVVFAGYQSNTRPFYELMDVFVLASAHEAFGLVLVEAMYARLPVVATRVGGIPGVVSEPETAFLVDPGRPDQLSDRISYLLDNDEMRLQMGQAGFARAHKHFSSERYVRDVVRVYEEVLERELS